jgi:hypothetical protein
LHATTVLCRSNQVLPSYEKPPTLNGTTVSYSGKKVFDSPLLKADYNSGVVTITKGKRKFTKGK